MVFATGTCELDSKTTIPTDTAAEDEATLPDARKTDSYKNIFRVGAGPSKGTSIKLNQFC